MLDDHHHHLVEDLRYRLHHDKRKFRNGSDRKHAVQADVPLLSLRTGVGHSHRIGDRGHTGHVVQPAAIQQEGGLLG